MDVDPKTDQTIAVIDLDVDMTHTAPFVYQKPHTQNSKDPDPRHETPTQHEDESKNHRTPEAREQAEGMKTQPRIEIGKSAAEEFRKGDHETSRRSKGDEGNTNGKGSAEPPGQTGTPTKPQRIRAGSPQQEERETPEHDQEEKPKGRGRDYSPASPATRSRRQSRSRSSSRSAKKETTGSNELSPIKSVTENLAREETGIIGSPISTMRSLSEEPVTPPTTGKKRASQTHGEANSNHGKGKGKEKPIGDGMFQNLKPDEERDNKRARTYSPNTGEGESKANPGILAFILFDGGGIARKILDILGINLCAAVIAENDSIIRKAVAGEYGYSADHKQWTVDKQNVPVAYINDVWDLFTTDEKMTANKNQGSKVLCR